MAYISPPPGQVLFDLVIVSKKHGYGSTDTATAPILWWKMAGQSKEEIYERGKRIALSDTKVQERLAAYELADTEVHPGQIIRKYRLLPQFREQLQPAGDTNGRK